MPKGWIHIEEEEEDIKEVWQKQREALSASITLGRCSQLGCSAVSHQFPKASSKTTGITTSPSACWTTKDIWYLPSRYLFLWPTTPMPLASWQARALFTLEKFMLHLTMTIQRPLRGWRISGNFSLHCSSITMSMMPLSTCTTAPCKRKCIIIDTWWAVLHNWMPRWQSLKGKCWRWSQRSMIVRTDWWKLRHYIILGNRLDSIFREHPLRKSIVGIQPEKGVMLQLGSGPVRHGRHLIASWNTCGAYSTHISHLSFKLYSCSVCLPANSTSSPQMRKSSSYMLQRYSEHWKHTRSHCWPHKSRGTIGLNPLI